MLENMEFQSDISNLPLSDEDMVRGSPSVIILLVISGFNINGLSDAAKQIFVLVIINNKEATIPKATNLI